jgi:hypothetical protein
VNGMSDKPEDETPLPPLNEEDSATLLRLCIAAREDQVACAVLADFLEEHGIGALITSSYSLLMWGLRGNGPKVFQSLIAKSVHTEACRRGLLGWDTHPDTVVEVAEKPAGKKRTKKGR